MRYTTTVLATGGTTTGLPVPDDVLASLAAGRRPPVRVTVGGHTWRTSVASRDGRHLASLSAENRAAAAVRAGDEVQVDLELDTEPRTVEVPADLAAALDGAGLRVPFDALSASTQKRHVLAVTGAKAEATRQRRVASVLAELSAG